MNECLVCILLCILMSVICLLAIAVLCFNLRFCGLLGRQQCRIRFKDKEGLIRERIKSDANPPTDRRTDSSQVGKTTKCKFVRLLVQLL
jgi:hypothetical protein